MRARIHLRAAMIATAVIFANGALARAGAEPTGAQLDQARERFAAGRALEKDGRWSEALDAFQQVGAIKMTPQVRFHIALCLENVGVLTQALDGFVDARRA